MKLLVCKQNNTDHALSRIFLQKINKGPSTNEKNNKYFSDNLIKTNLAKSFKLWIMIMRLIVINYINLFEVVYSWTN